MFNELKTKDDAWMQSIHERIDRLSAMIDGIFGDGKEHVYQAAMLDPHTGAELSPDDIISMCDDLIEAHTKAGYPVF